MIRRSLAAGAVVGLALGVVMATPAPVLAQAPDKYKIGIVTFLTGPGAPPSLGGMR